MESATFSPRAKSKKKIVCVVKGCKSASNRDVNIRFHYFPMKTNRFVCSKNLFGQTERKDQLEVWMKMLKIKEVNSGMKVCSLHFCKNDYVLPNAAPKRKRLKTTAVPSLNLPHNEYTTSKKRNTRVLNRNLQKNKVQKNLKPNELVSQHEDAFLDNKHEYFKTMGKKRSGHIPTPNRVKVEVKDEIPDNEVHVARDRLKGALRELLHHSDEGSSMDSSEDTPAPEMKHQLRKTPKPSLPPPPTRRLRRRRQLPADQLFHHTYVMKLFDRSVDLAQFREDTPLYPICRAWLANQPRNPNLVPKIRSPSPEIIEEVHSESIFEDVNGELRDVHSLPEPLPREEILTRNRIPSPIPQPEDKLELNYEGQVLKSRELLMKGHRAHWSAVRRKWHAKAQKNEKRFYKSAQILGTIFKRAQTEFE
ncbi:hypothetical protein PV325_009065 [Microctonus aethiopoides]|nr:hypothetical protein PV325_009065 [Microctonus aethiopoides]